MRFHFVLLAGLVVACGGSASALSPGEPCPVTQPNGSTPPLERAAARHHGNGAIWTGLWLDGKVIFEPGGPGVVDEHGLAMKWWWWRAEPSEQLRIEGRRLDGDARPLEADIPLGYAGQNFQATALLFPTTGCWEVTGHAGDASLTFVTEVVSLY